MRSQDDEPMKKIPLGRGVVDKNVQHDRDLFISTTHIPRDESMELAEQSFYLTSNKDMGIRVQEYFTRGQCY